MPIYDVTVSRSIVQFMDLRVEADTEDDAKETALAEAQSMDSDIGWEAVGEGDDYEAHEITEVDEDAELQAALASMNETP